MFSRLLPTASLLLGSLVLLAAPAQAGVFVGVHIGGPACYPPAPGVVYPVAPIVVTQPTPVVVAEPAPVIVSPAPPSPVVYTHPLWHVQYRTCPTGPWYEYGAYVHRGRAVHAEVFLARQGYEVRLVRY
jgi:hypothetical protein